MTVAALLITIILFAVMLVVPVFELIGLIMGLEFIICNEIVVVISQASLALAAMVALLIIKPEYGRAGRIFWLLLPPLALINAICFTNSQWPFSIVLAILWSVCCFVVYVKFVPDSGFKATSAVFSVLLAVALVVMYIIYGIFMPVTDKSDVTESFLSPDGSLVAEEMSVDGVFSDSMRIEVRKVNPDIEAGLGYYVSDSIVIYEGEAYETETAKISWKDNNTLVVNGTEYPLT